MFAKLTGTIDTLMADSLILDVGGVGYHVFASRKTLGAIGNAGDGASLMIETHVREDHIHLYGFSSVAERDWFRLLTSVQGVGAKSGLAILGVCSPDQLIMAIAANDAHMLRQADGVGPKLATRIVTELKDKVQNMNLGDVAMAPVSSSSAKGKKGAVAAPAAVPDLTLDQDVVSALVNLGYGRAEAFTAVMQARKVSNDTASLSFDHLIKQALKDLAG